MQRSEVEDTIRPEIAAAATTTRRRWLRQAFEVRPASIDGKLNLSTKEVIHAIGSPRLFQRMRCAKWIVPLFQSRDQLYPAAQILHAQQRLQDGERPPLLPSEIKQRAKSGLN